MSASDKLLLIGALIFFAIGATSHVVENNVCAPEWRAIEEHLDYIKKPNSIKRIELYKAYQNFKTNLIADTIKITDRSDIELIQKMINTRYPGTWNRSKATWNIRMRLILDNEKSFDFKVSKISNNEARDMTHLYFGSRYCSDNLPSSSEALGNYLENLTAFKGYTY